MNGAETLARTLLAGGVDTCFSNPGTSEMHFVAALDRVEGIRCILCLFEGVATGAADGYARMAEKPAATLLHLGPGLANGLANLHNAKKARTPVVNIVGEHATYHLRHDAPLTSDTQGVARPFSHWVRTGESAESIGADGAAAIEAAREAPGQIATLILPADTAWNEGGAIGRPNAPAARKSVPPERIEAAAAALRKGGPSALMLGGAALRETPLEDASRIAQATGARLFAENANARVERGAGRVAVERFPYTVDQSLAALAGVKTLVLAGGKNPVAFFAYPGRPGVFAPPDCEVVLLAEPGEDIAAALASLAEALDCAGLAPARAAPQRSSLPGEFNGGKITPEAIGAVLGALLPENAIVCDEAVTTGRAFWPATQGAPPHTWLQLTGGAIGLGLPLAVGAAVACPDRKVIGLQADGSAMYTIQALWTAARERLDIVTLIFANRSYAILRGELANVGAQNPGRTALDMLSLEDPTLDFVKLAEGMGVKAERVETCEALAEAFGRALRERGPWLVEVVM